MWLHDSAIFLLHRSYTFKNGYTVATPLHAKKWRIYAPYTLYYKQTQANCGLAVNPYVSLADGMTNRC